MKFALIGGDLRFMYLQRCLCSDGHEAAAFALEKAVPCAASASLALEGAGCIVLPLPCTREGRLNAPFAGKEPDLWNILSQARPGTPVLAGQADPVAGICREFGLPLTDYYKREELMVKNAMLTADAAANLMEREGRSLCSARVLLCGFGRIGRFLAPRLLSRGARLTVAARSGADLAWAQCMGCATLDLKHSPAFQGFDYAVNTIPAPIFGREALQGLAGAKLLELASPPYGFDREAAAGLGLEIHYAPGLPGKELPQSAAEAIRDAIYHSLEESS